MSRVDKGRQPPRYPERRAEYKTKSFSAGCCEEDDEEDTRPRMITKHNRETVVDINNNNIYTITAITG